MQIIFNNSDNLVLAPMRATYNCPRGKYMVIRNVCSNGAFGIVVSGTILFCGEISSGLASGFVVDRVNVCAVNFVRPTDTGILKLYSNISCFEWIK